MLFRRQPTPMERPTDLLPQDRVWQALRHQPVDRVPCVDAYFLPETLLQWQREGFPEGADPAEFFDLDLVCLPVDCTMGWRKQIIDETDEYRIVLGADGVTRKEWKIYHTAPQELDFPVKEPRDWRAIRPTLKAHEDRLPSDWVERLIRAKERPRFVALAFLEPCTLARRLLGSRQWVEVLASPTLWLDEMLETGVRLIVDMVDIARQQALSLSVSFDGVWLHAELAYTHGAFMTDQDYQRVVLPYHRMLCQELKQRGMAVLLYTTGNVHTFLRFIRKSGFDAVLPLEAYSHNDLAAYKSAYGHQVALGGNVAVDRLMESDDAADQEVSQKVTVGLGDRFTGYLFCLDRAVPPMVPLARYQRALHLARSLSPNK